MASKIHIQNGIIDLAKNKKIPKGIAITESDGDLKVVIGWIKPLDSFF